MAKNLHTVPDGKKWAVKREGVKQALHVYQTQAQAVKQMRTRARIEHVETFLHDRKGQIRERNTYKRDSYPPKG